MAAGASGPRIVRDAGRTPAPCHDQAVIEAFCPLPNRRLDFLVDGCVVVELKAGGVLPATAEPQLRNYLRATTLEVGLLLWFGPKPQFKRIVAFNAPASFLPHPKTPVTPREQSGAVW